ncbi:trichohyalin [Tachysurus vachellii]|uniref:trichohyalin n=1 Tax=Tachysurus vachellii TaxID=175792 RepID=UPI00296A9176|nr:trichohyalin [Tachysurus vachellii]
MAHQPGLKFLFLSPSASLDRSASVSKDTGLGTDKASSAPDGLNSDHADLTAVELRRSGTEIVGLREDESKEHVVLGADGSWHTGGGGAVRSSKREQCLWRLERLLGTDTGQITGEEEDDEEDSVRTEDFSARFLDQMLDPTKLSVAGSRNQITPPDFSAPDSESISSDTTLLTEPQVTSGQNTGLDPGVTAFKSPSRQLADQEKKHDTFAVVGVQLKSFDFVAIDSDLDSEDEVNGVCVGSYRSLRSPASIQRREKWNQSRRNNTNTNTNTITNTSTSSSTASTACKEKAGDKSQSEFSYVELSLADQQQQNVAVVRGVERLREEVEQAEKEQHTLHLSLTHTRTHTQLLRSELHKLQAQRDLYIQEVKALQESQAALQRHITTVNHDNSPHRHLTSGCTSVLEMEEMDRLLDNAKSELFSEQRRFRHMLDSMQERLEEVTQELEQKQVENSKLREKCSQLEEKLTTATKSRQELQESVWSERVEQEGQLAALEKIIAQKEMLHLATQEEKNRLEMEIKAVREANRAKLTAALAHAQTQKEVEVEQLRTQMTLDHVEELQRMKEEEVNRLQECLKQQQEELRRREEELRGESQEQVKKAVEREQRKWEELRAESLREQKVRLEKQIQEVERRGRADVEREKRSALALQNKVLELQKSEEELNSAASKHTALIRALRDEHQTELYKLRRQLQQEAESEAVRLKEFVKRSEQELQAVRGELAECERLQQGAEARNEQKTAGWAQDIRNECVCLQELLTHNGFTVDNTHLSHSVTVSEAVQVLQSLRKSLQHLITSLQNHITSLTHTKQQLSSQKEEELRVQREQLTAEKERAVNSLREKLIEEHIEELSNLNRVRLREDDDGDCMAARLRRQLRAKDEELRQIQRNMVQWKEKTTARLAHKFQQELTSELERKTCRQKSEQRRRLEQLEGEMRLLTASSSNITDVPASSASSAHVPDAASSHDLDSHKLLRHLQSRIRQLQADAQSHSHTYTPGGMRLNRDRGNSELAGSYLETIAPEPDSCVTRQSSDLRTTRKLNL